MSTLLAWQVRMGFLEALLKTAEEQEKLFWALLEQIQAGERDVLVKLNQAGIGTDPFTLLQLLAAATKQLAARGVPRAVVLRAVMELGGDL